MKMSEKRHGQTAREWAEERFSDADCPGCGRGIDHHWIVPGSGDFWVTRCYERPKVINTVLVWAVDESGYLTDDDDGGQFTRLSCQAVTTVQFDVESASPGGMRRLETLMSSGLFGIIPPKLEGASLTTWEPLKEIEADEVYELRINLAHFNVDLESYDESLKSVKRVKRGWS